MQVSMVLGAHKPHVAYITLCQMKSMAQHIDNGTLLENAGHQRVMTVGDGLMKQSSHPAANCR